MKIYGICAWLAGPWIFKLKPCSDDTYVTDNTWCIGEYSFENDNEVECPVYLKFEILPYGVFFYYKNGDTYGKVWVQQTDFINGKKW